MRFSIKVCSLIVILILAGCGGGSSSSPDPVEPDPTPALAPTPQPTPPSSPAPDDNLLERQVDAARLLNQATFGASMDAIDYAAEIGAEA